MPAQADYIKCLNLLLVLLFGTIAPADPAPEVRATWLTTTANDAIGSPAKTADTMARLRKIGLNTVYVECWKNGYTEFPSDTMQRTIGVAQRVNPAKTAPQRDLLGECIIEAHRNRLFCVAWFEYGFMAAHGETTNELRGKREWLSLDQKGSEVAKNGFVWLNPLRPECQELLIGIVIDAVKRHDLDGIQLDDRLAWPGLEMGYDEYTKRIYSEEHGGKNLPTDIADAEWVKWRAAKVTAFADRLVKAVRTTNPEILISLSPGPAPWAYENYMCDWPQWRGWDEFVPQCYRADFAGFEKSWNEQLDVMGERKSELVAGIRLVGDEPDVPASDPTHCVELIRKSNARGHCWWFSKGVLGPFEQEIAKLYDVEKQGHAVRPDRPMDWRPAPVVAVREGKSWTVDVPEAGNYREIHRIDGAWRDVGSTGFIKGKSYLKNDTGDAVELLRDRRGSRRGS